MTLECFKLSLNRLLLQPKSLYGHYFSNSQDCQADPFNSRSYNKADKISNILNTYMAYAYVHMPPPHEINMNITSKDQSALFSCFCLGWYKCQCFACTVRFAFPKKFIFASFSMFDLIRGDHCNNTELEHFPSFYFPQEL